MGHPILTHSKLISVLMQHLNFQEFVKFAQIREIVSNMKFA